MGSKSHKFRLFAISLLSVVLLAGVTSVSNFDTSLQNNSIEKSEYSTSLVQFASAALHTEADKEATVEYVGSTFKLHDNDSITQPIGEGISRDLSFPAHGTDQLFLLDIGIFRDGIVRSSQLNQFTNTVGINFVTDNFHGLQVSTTTYNDGFVEIVQTATTISGTNYVIFNIEATNISGSTINDFSIGVYGDYDVDGSGDFSDDFGKYDATNDIMITFEHDHLGVETYVGLSGVPASDDFHLDVFGTGTTSLADIFPPENIGTEIGPIDVTVGLVWDDPGTFANGETFTVNVISAAATTEAALLAQIAAAKAPPVIDIVITGTPGNPGWFITDDVNVDFTVTGAVSTVGCVDTLITDDTDGTNFDCSATNFVGTTVAPTVTIKLDKTLPEISGVINPLPNLAGWNNGEAADPTVEWTCTDALTPGSGVLSQSPNPTQSTETDSTNHSGDCEDVAGNDAVTAVVEVKLDRILPVITGVINPLPNLAGWNNGVPTDPTVEWTCIDPLLPGSDVLSQSPNPTQSTETPFEGTDHLGDCEDVAGNDAAQASVNVKLDKTAPLVDFPFPVDQRTGSIDPQNDGLTLLTAVAYTDPYTVTETLSGVETIGCLDDDDLSTLDGPDGTSSGLFSVGITTNTCNATDVAGNLSLDTVFTEAIAKVVLTDLCVTGYSSAPVGTPESPTQCFNVQDDGVPITEIDSLWGVSDLITVKTIFYGFKTPASEPVTGISLDVGTNDPAVISLTVPELATLLGGDEDIGETFDFNFNYAGPDTLLTGYGDTNPQPIKVTMSVNPDFTSDQDGLPVAQVNVFKHPTDFDVPVDQMTDGAVWESFSSVTGDLDDTSLLVNNWDPLPFVDISGDGMGSFPFDVNTDNAGSFTADGDTMSFVGTDTIVFSYVGDDFYLETADHTDTYSTIKRIPVIFAEPVKPKLAGTDITVRGTFEDPISGNAIAGRTITVEVISPPGTPFPLGIDDAITTIPSRLQSPSSFTITSLSPDTIQFKAGDFGVHDTEPIYVVLTVEPMGDTTAVISYSDSDGNGQNINVANPGAGSIPIQMDLGSGVKMWEVLSVTDGGVGPVINYIPISLIEEKNVHFETTLLMEFDSSDTGVSFLRFGGIETSGTTNQEFEEDIRLKLEFDGSSDLLYFNAIPFEFAEGEGFFTTPLTDKVLGASATGNIGSEVPDTGVGIVPISCLIADTDGDALCPEWESDWVTDTNIQADDGIPFKIGTTDHFYKLPGTIEGTKDLIAEWDAMTYTESAVAKTHAPSATAKAAIIAAFDLYSINLIVQPSGDSIPHEDLISMWDDFNDLKLEFLGTSDEQITLAASTPTITINPQLLLLAFEDNLDDGSGNSVVTTVNAGGDDTTFTAGPDGKAFAFDGSSHFETNSADFDFGKTDAFSGAAWINAESSVTATDVLIGKLNGGLGYQLYVSTDSDNIRVQIGENSANRILREATSTAVRDGTFHHVAFSYDGSEDIGGVHIYIDGTEATSYTDITNTLGDASTIHNTEALTIGNQRPGGSFFFSGEMDDVRVYGFELTEGQVTSLFESFVTSAISNWNFEDVLTDSVDGNDGDDNKGAVSYDPSGVTGKAVILDGTAHVTTNDASFDFAQNEDFTLTAFFKTDISGVTDVLLGKLNRGAGYQVYLKSNNEVVVQIGKDSDERIVVETVGANVRDNVFHHIAMVYSGSGAASGVKVYLDGVEASLTINDDSLTADDNISTNKKFTIGNQNERGKFFFTGQMDDVRVYEYALNSMQVANIANPQTNLQSLLEISAMDLTTPNTPSTSGDTEAIIHMTFDVTLADASSLTGDDNGQLSIDSMNFGISHERARISSVNDPFATVTAPAIVNILSVRAPVWTVEPLTAADVGTIKVPLISQSLITNVALRDDFTATTSLLIALSQAERYCLFLHSIGGQSGQAELLGNDCAIALGDGFSDPDSGGHAEGSDEEMEGTVVHEFGHLLNMRHGGPNYLLAAPDFTLEDSLENCIPIQRSIMTYAYQLPDFLGNEWVLEFNARDDASETGTFHTLDEAVGVDENVGWTLSGGPTIFWGTPGSAFWETRSGPADGTALDWSGNGDTTEALASYDLNHIKSVTGCEATANSVFTIYNEPAEFDYNFRNGPLGEYDGRGGGNSLVLQLSDSEPNKITVKQLRDAGAEFIIIPPMKIDGEEAFKAGREIPMMLIVHDRDDFDSPIVDAEIQIWHVFPVEEGNTGELQKELIATLVYQSDQNRYRFDWKTAKDFSSFGTTGINYVMISRDSDGNIIGERILIISEIVNPMPLEITATGGPSGEIIEGVTVKIKWK